MSRYASFIFRPSPRFTHTHTLTHTHTHTHTVRLHAPPQYDRAVSLCASHLHSADGSQTLAVTHLNEREIVICVCAVVQSEISPPRGAVGMYAVPVGVQTHVEQVFSRCWARSTDPCSAGVTGSLA